MIMPTIRHLISIDDISHEEIDDLFDLTRQLRENQNSLQVIPRADDRLDLLAGKVLACLFYEPSTRTSSSFIAAMTRLGGSVIPITQGVQFSSVSKGETLSDTILTLGQYADAIVLRHPVEGSAKIAASVSRVPVINAGDGAGEHPTQALLDLFTMQDQKGNLTGKTIALVGDLLYGRTIHSLVRLLAGRGVHFLLVSPEALRLPQELRDLIQDAEESLDLRGAIARADVIYMTRVQKERFLDASQYESVKDAYRLTPSLMKHAKPDSIVMHPLPRVNEIDTAIDLDSRAIYFEQVRNGMFVRMAILYRYLVPDAYRTWRDANPKSNS